MRPVLFVAAYPLDREPRLVSTVVHAGNIGVAVACEYQVTRCLDWDDAARKLTALHVAVRHQAETEVITRVIDWRGLDYKHDLFRRIVADLEAMPGVIPNHPSYARALFVGMARLGEYMFDCVKS